MKFLAFFVLAAVAISAHALTDEETVKVKEIIADCVTSTGVDKELIVKARTHEYTGRDPKLAAFYSCAMEKMHFLKADGSFDVDRMVEKLAGNVQKEIASNAVKKCAISDAAISKDENSMNMMYCFYKTVGKDYKLV